MHIYVGNLAYSTRVKDVRQLFEKYGAVEDVKILSDRKTGQPRGFGFVLMPDARAAQTAIAQLHGTTFEGRPLRVNESRPRDDQPQWAY